MRASVKMDGSVDSNCACLSWLRNIVAMAGEERSHNAFVWVPYGTIDESPGEADRYLFAPVVFVPVVDIRRATAAFLERRIMKKLNRVASLFAVAAVASSGVFAQTVDNWRATDGTVWKNGTNELCWRDAGWTPATAAKDCDGALKPAPKAEAPKPAAPVAPVAPPAPPKPVTPPAPPKPVSEKVTFAADAFFDFDKAVLKTEAKAKLDDLVSKTGGINLEVIIAVGHTDSVGSDEYNQKLSVRRSEAVKAYLVTKGVEKNRVYTEGKGEKQPVADNKTSEGRSKNRRVEIEVVGTRNLK
jgi:OOP family OmpA-OmpF porin